ncbi:MAG: sugar phosphate nucleotidyltransferase, partial [Bacteroidetes bacterium]|nr:sugar phosphate nucleotidyltransferase [Bacteroidota bacterium]
VAFADTLFHADFKIDTTQDGIIWTKRIENPSAFGVVQVDENGTVKQFWEKPTEFVSDQAIIGIYYFKDGEYLHKELQYLLDNDIKVKGEFQLTDGLENMLQQGAKFKTVDVDHWLDCGNKEATVFTNKMVLELSTNKDLVSVDAKVSNSVIIPPCFIAQGAVITDSVVGPYVSVGANTKVANSVLRNSIVLENANISNANIENSMLGNYAVFAGKTDSINLGDYSEAC